MWTSLVPLPYRWAIVAALFAAATGFGYVRGIAHESDKRDLADAKRAKATESSIVARVQSNTSLALRQQEDNRIITKAHDEELASIDRDYNAARTTGLRIIAPVCHSAAGAAKAESSSSTNDAPTIKLPTEVERRLFDLAEDADRCSVQLGQLQKWVVAQKIEVE